MEIITKCHLNKPFPDLLLSYISGIWHGLDWIARKRALAIILIAFLAFVSNLCVSKIAGISNPEISDEFSYLLAADTFANGRLANPAHPMRAHFESFNILNQPVYMSKYPPAQGLILAAGKVFFGQPIFGVWISVALMCSAICWMLYGWLPPKWAVLGGMIAVLKYSFLTYWSYTYWGGAVAGFGGALVFGALRRVLRQPHIRDTLLMGLGFGVLANSRPFEGLIAGIPVAAALLFWILSKKKAPLKIVAARFAVPLFFTLILIVIWMGVYNRAITRNSLKMPYSLCQKTQTAVPIFIWQPLKPDIHYSFKEMDNFETDFSKRFYFEKKNFCGFFKVILNSLKRYAKFYLGWLLLIPAVSMFFWILQDKWMRFAFLTVFLVTILSTGMIACFAQAHYIAPITCLIIAFAVQGLRYINILKLRCYPAGRVFVFMLIFFLSLQILANAGKIFNKTAKDNLQIGISEIKVGYIWSNQRAKIIKQLQQMGGRHLVIVRYGEKHDYNFEWVYNEADIDNAIVVWAREMDDAQNRKLLGYFKGRNAWLLEINNDNVPPRLAPYPFDRYNGKAEKYD